MEKEAKVHGKKSKQIEHLPETTTLDKIIEGPVRSQPPSATPDPKSFPKYTPGTSPRSRRRARRVQITTPDKPPERIAIYSNIIVKINSKYCKLNFDGSDV
ncbi:hypothetical protein O181_012848 [Austropuccinia psidii MF-1]|uniref:Uncharacterized protein n=1 Tax=Austropuccinia psidii MF-1 TaxID=1389203 RepID=A0A9Q3BXJ2_9BASI|nr:hypothetical protein [Austropuccinia psidii MF-1]